MWYTTTTTNIFQVSNFKVAYFDRFLKGVSVIGYDICTTGLKMFQFTRKSLCTGVSIRLPWHLILVLDLFLCNVMLVQQCTTELRVLLCVDNNQCVKDHTCKVNICHVGPTLLLKSINRRHMLWWCIKLVDLFIYPICQLFIASARITIEHNSHLSVNVL